MVPSLPRPVIPSSLPRWRCAHHRALVPITTQPALKMEWDGRQGHRQKENLLCVLPRRERQSVVPSGAPGHTGLRTGLRTHGTRREPACGDRPQAVYCHSDPVFMARWCPSGACGTGLKTGWFGSARRLVPKSPCSPNLAAGARAAVRRLADSARRSSSLPGRDIPSPPSARGRQ
jgi:hypothetical protein